MRQIDENLFLTAVLSILPKREQKYSTKGSSFIPCRDPYTALILLESYFRLDSCSWTGQAEQLRRSEIQFWSVIVEPKKQTCINDDCRRYFYYCLNRKKILASTKEVSDDAMGEQVKDWDALIQIKKVIAITSWQNGKVREAEQHLLDAVRIAKQSQSEHLTTVLNKLSFIVKDSEQSIRYAREALIQAEKLGGHAQIGGSYVHLSAAHQLGDLQYALFYGGRQVPFYSTPILELDW